MRSELRKQLEDSANVVLIDDEERGFALAGHGWLQRLFVREAAWGTGVADELHAAALDALRSQGRDIGLALVSRREYARRNKPCARWVRDSRVALPPAAGCSRLT